MGKDKRRSERSYRSERWERSEEEADTDLFFTIPIGTIFAKWETPIPIHQHPYYIALTTNNEELYRKAVNVSDKQSRKPTADWHHLLDLRYHIFTEGFYNGGDPIILERIDGRWCCTHGRHRVCILLSLYGPELKLIVKRKGDTAKVKDIEITHYPISGMIFNFR
eukprot:Pompholyxophrys_sp_v1_NODE_3_length_18401_cov_4.332280.p10 type:complete len:165 gc:universal NODE_3_length_18401_cov_4.332280:7040-7534(+)